jgi:hypothetical protein
MNGISIAAQVTNPESACSSPQNILQRYVDAVGGEAAIQQIQTSVVEAKETEPYSFGKGLAHYKYRFKWKAPNKVVTQWTHIENLLGIPTPFSRATFIFDGTQWSDFDGTTSRNDEQVPLPERELKAAYAYNDDLGFMRFRVVADPLMIARDKDLYSSFEIGDSAGDPGNCILQGNRTNVFGAKRSDSLMFDSRSGLLRVWKIQAVASPRFEFSFTFDDYRQVGAVKIPFYIYFDFYKNTFRIVNVKHGVPLSDSDFVSRPKKSN